MNNANREKQQMGKVTGLLKIGDIKRTFHVRIDMTKDRNGKDLT